MLSALIAPVAGLIVQTSTSIALDGVVKQLVPSDLKALPAFGIKLGTAVIGGLIAAKIAGYAMDNIQSVVDTATKQPESEEVVPEEIQDEN